MSFATLSPARTRARIVSAVPFSLRSVVRGMTMQVLHMLSKAPKYQWMITQDLMPHESGSRVIHHGPEGRQRYTLAQLVQKGQRFRMLDASGSQKLYGFILGRYKGPEPLVEYGQRFECVAIDYAHRGGWIRCAELRVNKHDESAVVNHALPATASEPQPALSQDVRELSPVTRAAAGFLR